ncbi:hypothetical protein KC909_06065, partial [Candidatus Dojkabacteria bacterium]|nr:hypothetical protein [Candidatus Dojkabacteria bacterium]
IEQDRNLKLSLEDFDGELEISWTNNTTWEFTLDYIDLTDNRYYSVKDVYDDLSLFINPTNLCFTSLPVPTANPNNRVVLNLQDPFNASCLSNGRGNYELVALRLKPLGSSTNVSVIRTSGTGYPAQVRVITSEAFSNVQDVPNVPKAVVELLQPLYESPIELFDYVYRGETTVSK